MKISLCLISSLDDVPKAKELISSLHKHVDEVCLTVTDTSFAETIPNVKVSTFEWVDDFAKARNFNFSQASGDWILWLDADDTLTNPELLKALIAEGEEKQIDGFFLLYKYNFDKNGNCIDEHWKCQILKNNGHFEWVGAIHEDPIAVRKSNWAKAGNLVRIHHSGEAQAKKSQERNLRILLKERDKNPNEPRTYFYLGRSYMAEGEFQKAIDSLTKYLELSGWDDERYEATLIIGRCFYEAGDLDQALLWYHEAILEKEQYPDAYAQKGFIYLTKKEYEKALYNFAISSKMETPQGATFFNPMLYSRDIYVGMAMCYMHLGRLKEGLGAINVAYKADPKSEHVKDLLNIIGELKRKNDAARKYLELSAYINNPKLVQALMASVPPQLQDNEMILTMRNTFCPPKTWGPKSIAVYCGPTVEPWTPESQNTKGIGGSETAVIELTKRLAKLGWAVTVYNYCDMPPEGKVFDGVLYKNYWTFNVNDNFDVLYSWRLPELFEHNLKARLTLVDMHDVMTPAEFSKDRLAKIDKIFVKTKYHRSLYPNVPDDKFVIIGNGIDLDRFAKKVTKEPFRFCYTSSANRGLDILLKMWPKIKKNSLELNSTSTTGGRLSTSSKRTTLNACTG